MQDLGYCLENGLRGLRVKVGRLVRRGYCNDSLDQGGSSKDGGVLIDQEILLILQCSFFLSYI